MEGGFLKKKKNEGRPSPWKPLANLQDIVSFQAKEVEETIEGMLLRLEEFCSLTDMVSVCPGAVDLHPGPAWSFLGKPCWWW